jgi:dynactin complex subunit
MVRGELGTVRFVGGVHYARGDYVGIELDDASGKNDGAVKGVAYFACAPKHGLFVRKSEVEMLQ